jgi:hypothetical protein
VGGSASPRDGELALGPVASRVYETPAALLHATFSPTSVLLASVPSDGWFPTLWRRKQVERSPAQLVRALHQSGLPDPEASQLADKLLADWESIEIPEEQSRRQQLADVLRIVAMLLGLLARTPRFMWEVIRGRSDVIDPQADFVRPGSSEYGVIRLVRTSHGWAEFEFWGGPMITLGVYRDDGWLPLSGHRHYLERTEVIDALRAQGVPGEEAERLYGLVLAERQARIAPSDD